MIYFKLFIEAVEVYQDVESIIQVYINYGFDAFVAVMICVLSIAFFKALYRKD